MKQIVSAVATAGVADAISKTKVVRSVISEAIRKTEAAANLLEKIARASNK